MTTPSQNLITSPKIGEGIYLAVDVAQILNLPYHKVRGLMNGYWQSYTFGSDYSRAINFYALIEFYIFYHLRQQDFSANDIRALHTQLAKDFKVRYPFASLKLSAIPKNNKKGKGEVWVDHSGLLMKADGKRQPSFREFIEPYLRQIDFGKDSIAKRFFPLVNYNNSKNVVVDPMHQFGQPVIIGTNIQTATIHNLFMAGETKKNISILYSIEENAIEDVLLYYNKRA